MFQTKRDSLAKLPQMITRSNGDLNEIVIDIKFSVENQIERRQLVQYVKSFHQFALVLQCNS